MFERIRRFFDTNRYYNAVKRANAAYTKTGERMYILLQTDGKLIIMDRSFFRQMKKEHRLPANTSINDLQRECLYHTPYNNGVGAMTKERMGQCLDRYLKWCKADREQKKLIKKISKKH